MSQQFYACYAQKATDDNFETRMILRACVPFCADSLESACRIMDNAVNAANREYVHQDRETVSWVEKNVAWVDWYDNQHKFNAEIGVLTLEQLTEQFDGVTIAAAKLNFRNWYETDGKETFPEREMPFFVLRHCGEIAQLIDRDSGGNIPAPPATSGKGKKGCGAPESPRAAYFMELHSKGMGYAAIRDHWNGLSHTERKRIDPDDPSPYPVGNGKEKRTSSDAVRGIIRRRKPTK